jgi:lipopolysaccharide/colanic/teichoic acid biosynthesis glycosyltransferase
MRPVDTNSNHFVSEEGIFTSIPEVWPGPASFAIPKAPEPFVGGAEKSKNPSVSIHENLRDIAMQSGFGIEIPVWKRALDLTCMILALPLWLPVFALIALWVKLVSPGPIFFRQERIGFRGSRFLLLKFRTMKVNVETKSHEKHLEQLINGNAPMTKLDLAGDPRIIAGGRILRALGLDELPQLFNVFQGDMSLVGPRPCTPYEFDRYQDWQKERINALPGLTGYWQVNGKNKTTFTKMIEMDIWYTRNLSFWLDLWIMLRTAPALIMQLLESRGLVRIGRDADKTTEAGQQRPVAL